MIHESGWRELLLWLLRRRRSLRVIGDSMSPAILAEDIVLYRPFTFEKSAPQPAQLLGRVVVARHPHRRDLMIIKRLTDARDNEACWLLGDNPAASSDSRSFGAVAPSMLQGIVTSLIRRKKKIQNPAR